MPRRRNTILVNTVSCQSSEEQNQVDHTPFVGAFTPRIVDHSAQEPETSTRSIPERSSSVEGAERSNHHRLDLEDPPPDETDKLPGIHSLGSVPEDHNPLVTSPLSAVPSPDIVPSPSSPLHVSSTVRPVPAPRISLRQRGVPAVEEEPPPRRPTRTKRSSIITDTTRLPDPSLDHLQPQSQPVPPRPTPRSSTVPEIIITPSDFPSSDPQLQPSIVNQVFPPDIEMSDASSDLSAVPDSPNKKMKREGGGGEDAGPSVPPASTSAEVSRTGNKVKGKKRKATTSAEDAIGDILDGRERRTSPRKRSKDSTSLLDAPAPPPRQKVTLRFGSAKGSTSPEKRDWGVPIEPDSTQKPSFASDPPHSTVHSLTGGLSVTEQAPITERKAGVNKKKKEKVAQPPDQALAAPAIDHHPAAPGKSSQIDTLGASGNDKGKIKKRKNRVESDGEDEDAKAPIGIAQDRIDVDPPEAHTGAPTPPPLVDQLGKDESARSKKQSGAGKSKDSTTKTQVVVEGAVSSVSDNRQLETDSRIPGAKKKKEKKKDGHKEKRKDGQMGEDKDGKKTATVPGGADTTTKPVPPRSLDNPAQPSPPQHMAASLEPAIEGSKSKPTTSQKSASDTPARPIHVNRKGKTATPQPPGQIKDKSSEATGSTARSLGSKEKSKVSKDATESLPTKEKSESTAQTPRAGQSETSDKSTQKKPIPPRQNAITPSASSSLLQQTLAALTGGGSTPKRDAAEKGTKKSIEKPKPKDYVWGRDYQPNAQQRAEIEASRPEREAKQAERRLWRRNAINLQEAKDAYRWDAMCNHEIKLAHPIGIIPKPETSFGASLDQIWAHDAKEEAAGYLIHNGASSEASKLTTL